MIGIQNSIDIFEEQSEYSEYSELVNSVFTSLSRTFYAIGYLKVHEE